MNYLDFWKISIFILILLHAFINVLIFFPVIKKNYIITLLRYSEYKWKLIYNTVIVPLFFEVLLFQNTLLDVLSLPADLEKILAVMLLVSLFIIVTNDILCLISFDKLCCLTIANSWIFCITCIITSFFLVLYPLKFYFSLTFSIVYSIISLVDAYSFLSISIITEDRFINERMFALDSWELPNRD